MAELKACFEKLGFTQVKTYINSGNVIFKTSQTDHRILETKIEKAITATFTHRVAVVIRSLEEMHTMIKQLPKGWLTNKEQRCNVIFLRHTIDSPDIMKELNPKEGIEEVLYYPGVLLWSANTSDLTRSTMIKLASKPIYKEMTIRILNSAQKIYALMQEIDAESEK